MTATIFWMQALQPLHISEKHVTIKSALRRRSNSCSDLQEFDTDRGNAERYCVAYVHEKSSQYTCTMIPTSEFCCFIVFRYSCLRVCANDAFVCVKTQPPWVSSQTTYFPSPGTHVYYKSKVFSGLFRQNLGSFGSRRRMQIRDLNHDIIVQNFRCSYRISDVHSYRTADVHVNIYIWRGLWSFGIRCWNIEYLIYIYIYLNVCIWTCIYEYVYCIWMCLTKSPVTQMCSRHPIHVVPACNST